MSSNMRPGLGSGEGEGLVGSIESVEPAIGAVSNAPVAETNEHKPEPSKPA